MRSFDLLSLSVLFMALSLTSATHRMTLKHPGCIPLVPQLSLPPLFLLATYCAPWLPLWPLRGSPTLLAVVQTPSKAEWEIALPATHAGLCSYLSLALWKPVSLAGLAFPFATNLQYFSTVLLFTMGKNSWTKTWHYVLDGPSQEGCRSGDAFLIVNI